MTTVRRSSVSGLSEAFMRLFNLVHAGLFAAFLGSIIGFGGRLHFLLDLFAHFRLIYAVSLLAGCVIAFFQKRRKLLALWAVGLLINLLAMGPLFLSPKVQPLTSQSQKLRVMSVNVLRKNDQKLAVVDAVIQADPDIVIAVEVDQPWAQAFQKALGDGWPHSLVADRFDNYGILIYSKWPLIKAETFESLVAYVPTIRAEVQLQNASIVVYGVHTFPPLSDFNAIALQTQLADIAERVTGESLPVVVMGDLNSTPWSAYFKKFLKQANLVDSQKGFGPQSSWPSNFPYFGLPIDHVLTSPMVITKTRRIGSYNGSDHFPVTADLLVPQ